jgi:plastocyanin
MAIRDIYLKIEAIAGYSPVEPDDHVSPPIQYGRDCMRNPGHDNGTIPGDEINARRLTALVYREYLDPNWVVPKPDKIIAADINEPAFSNRVPGAVIYAKPEEWLRIHVKNADRQPHSFHIHGLRYGIDSDGSWPLGAQAADGRRSDEICPGSVWTYTFQITDEMIGAWPFHDHYRQIGAAVNRGLFGGLIVLPEDECEQVPTFSLPPDFIEMALEAARTPFAVTPPTHTGLAIPDHPMTRMAAAPLMTSPSMAGMDMGEGNGGGGDAPPLRQPSAELAPYLSTLDELAHAPQPLPDRDDLLHVPLFFHQMSGYRDTPVFQSGPLNKGATYTSPVFTIPGTYTYICGIHGAMMTGTVNVVPTGSNLEIVHIVDFAFNSPSVTVGVGGQVTWVNDGPSQHSVVEQGADSMPSFCFNGRSFVGNTPTIVAHAGQRIRWYVFDLDLGMGWHNFHTHGQRWNFAGQAIDVRSIGPAESFVVETEAPPVLALPPGYEHCHTPHEDADAYPLRGDFLVHCHVEMHMMAGLVAIVRSQQTVHLTPAEKQELETTIGLALDPGTNACPQVDLHRCANAVGGQIQELPGRPEMTFMHAVLLPKTNRLLFWGYGPYPDQTRLWDQDTGLYTQPVSQPAAIAGDQNIWSGAHAHLPDANGTILVHGGYHNNFDPPRTPMTEHRAFLFDPTTSTFSPAADMHAGRFYPTTVTMPDGNPITLYGQDNAAAGAPTSSSYEKFTPGGVGAWGTLEPLPFNYFYYPWTFLLPGGDLFIAGPQKPSRRFDPSVTPVVDDPGKQYQQLANPQRGVNMDGTAVLLPLQPPHYEARVIVAGGTSNGAAWVPGEAGALKTAEWIDLSVPAPAWQALPEMNLPRDKVNSVVLPDGRVLIVGGFETPPDGGPVEIFDPMDPTSGFQVGPNLKYARGYHSAAILMPDGSVIIGGDPNGANTPNERYLPSYFFRPRPTITAAPATITHGATFTIDTTVPTEIGQVLLVSPGAVTHGFNHNQRHIGCAIGGTTAGAVTAVAPPNGTIAPPGYYLLFIVDHDRIPSKASWIRLT